MSTLLILNAKIVNENSIVESDIYVRNGRIDKIDKDLSAMKVGHVLDVRGKYVMPGMIDDNVHFREPDKTGEINLYSESQAAVAGGITTFFDMPDPLPKTLDLQTLDEKMNLASEKSVANFSFYMGASCDNLEVIKALDPEFNCGVKVCLGDARGNMLVDKPDVLNEIFKHSPMLIAAHCEDMPTIIENQESYRQIYGDDIPFEFHSKIRSAEACLKAATLAVEMAQVHETRLHVLHVSSVKEVELFSSLPLHEKQITAEVCFPYLDFTDDFYTGENCDCKGALIKCNPSIKTEIDRAALFQGLMDNRLDNIGSAHTPYTWSYKKGNYFDVAAGMPLVQDAMPSLLEHYQDGIFSLEFIAQKTSHAVADLFNIKERGYIREGYWADLVVVDLDVKHTVKHEEVISKCAWTPYSGEEFRSSVYATVVNGHLVYANGKVRSGISGMQVEFERTA